MKIIDFVKNEKVLAFVGGILTATYGVKGIGTCQMHQASE